MRFGAKSATDVPRPQRRKLAAFINGAWSRGRKLRGFSTTALCAWLLFGRVATATAEPAARFADVPSAATQPALPAPPRAAPASSEVSPSPAAAVAPIGPSAAVVAPAPPAVPLPSESWSRRLARSHFERGEEEERRGDIPQALREYTETLAIDSTLGDAYLRLGALRERMGDAREAELVYSEAVRLGDTRARALVQRSHLLRAEGRSRDAVRDLEAAVELDANPAALAELAQHYVEARAFSAALFTFRRIVSSAQQSGDAAALENARLEVRALRVLAAETDPTMDGSAKHDWVGRSLASIARR